MKKLLLGMITLMLIIWAQENIITNSGHKRFSLKDEKVSLIKDESPAIDAITIPRMLSYQGKLTDSLGNPVPDGNYQLTLRLYTQETGGSPFWTEIDTVMVKKGLFSVLLGARNPITSIPDAGGVYLSLQVGTNPELTPRLRIVSSAYSFISERSANADLLQGKDTTALAQKFASAFRIGNSYAYEGNNYVDTLFKMASTGWYVVDDGDGDADHTLIIKTIGPINVIEYTLWYGDTVIHGEASVYAPDTITFPHYLGFQLTLARRESYIAHLIFNENDGWISCVYIKSHP